MIIYLFLAALCPRCCAGFSLVVEAGVLLIVVRGLLIVVASLATEHRLQQLWFLGSRAQTQWLWCTGLVALGHMRSSWTDDRTHVSYIGRKILYH